MQRLALSFFFFNDTATTEIYTLSLHDALPIFAELPVVGLDRGAPLGEPSGGEQGQVAARSEEHTSELQSRFDLVCRLLLEKKKSSSAPISARRMTVTTIVSSTRPGVQAATSMA